MIVYFKLLANTKVLLPKILCTSPEVSVGKWFLVLLAHWTHLGSFRKCWCQGFSPNWLNQNLRGGGGRRRGIQQECLWSSPGDRLGEGTWASNHFFQPMPFSHPSRTSTLGIPGPSRFCTFGGFCRGNGLVRGWLSLLQTFWGSSARWN